MDLNRGWAFSKLDRHLAKKYPRASSLIMSLSSSIPPLFVLTRPCACVEEGSLDNNPSCLADTGICTCKENVEGQNCDQCKLGFYNLALDDPWGCSTCFCYLHASTCAAANGFYVDYIESNFDSGV